MQEAELKFERENLEGIIPVGTYLADAARRMGIELSSESFGEREFFVVKITNGGDLLSTPTATEIEHLSEERRSGGERLAEQAKIEKAGEISIMTTEKPAETKPDYEAKKEEYRKEFESLPLEKKISSLVELEAIALGETFSFILNSPYQIAGKLVDVLAGFGFKIEDEAKKYKRPAEHQTEETSVQEEDKNGDAPSSPENTSDNQPSEFKNETEEAGAGIDAPPAA